MLEMLRPVYPSLFTPKPQVNDWTVWALRMVALGQMQLGLEAQAQELLRKGLAYVEASRKFLAGGFSSGVDDVYYLLLLGEYDEALRRLEAAIDRHWSMYSMVLMVD